VESGRGRASRQAGDAIPVCFIREATKFPDPAPTESMHHRDCLHLSEIAMITLSRTLRVALVAATLTLGACGGMMASNTVTFGATLTGAAEVPPVATPGNGTLTASLNKDTSELTWKITYTGLTGPAIGAHFHGPALAGANAPVALGFANPASPIEGKATLTAAQVADLMAGRWYANVHTAANKGGEIRGQLAPK